MLPQQINKRLNYHRNNNHHHVGYHPYYSSSPLGVPTSNLHCVSSSSASSSVSSSATSSHQYHHHHNHQSSVDSFRKEILLTQANISQFNSSNELSTSQNNNNNINNNTFQDDEHNLSSISTKTNPPTTPVSLTSQHNTPVINGSAETNENSPVYNYTKSIIINNNNKIFAEPILNVTPVTSISSASSVTNMKDKYSASCSSSCSSAAVSIYSSAQATYSRSSSMNSLNSFDIKSIHSSAPSDYSCVNNNNKQETGYVTPSCYSDLPDSPGELFPSSSTYNRLIINSSSLNNSANNHHRYLSHMNNTNNKLANTTGINEISVLTIDSNPSKSNDITIVERTVLAANSVNTTSHHLINNYGTSGCTTFIQNDDVDINDCDDENVVAYDVEGSLCDARSTRSNVSSLSFPTEPTADLTFIRNLLTQKSSYAAANFVTDQFSSQPQIVQQQQQPPQPQSTRLWSNYTFNKTNSFTPPVKLKPIDETDHKLLKTNKKLIYEDDIFCNDNNNNIDQDIQIEDEDDDCARSIASLPSDIVRDTNTSNINKSNFNALFNKLSNNLDHIKKTNKICESSPLINNTVSLNKIYQSGEQILDNSFNNNNNNNQDDNDEKILQDFIDEMLPIALANNNNANESNNESMNEEDEMQLLKYQLIYKNNDLERHVPLSSNLPKIDEVDEDEILIPKIKDKLLLKNNFNSSKSVVVQMTKTTLLRANKVQQNKSNLNSISKRVGNQLNENTSNEKRQSLSNSSSLNNIQSKCFNTSTKPSIVTKKLALMPSNKLNTTKTTSVTKRFNSTLVDNKNFK